MRFSFVVLMAMAAIGVACGESNVNRDGGTGGGAGGGRTGGGSGGGGGSTVADSGVRTDAGVVLVVDSGVAAVDSGTVLHDGGVLVDGGGAGFDGGVAGDGGLVTDGGSRGSEAPCTNVYTNDCDAGEACYVARQPNGDLETRCFTAGTSPTNGACNYANDCVSGNVCLGGSPSKCHAFCSTIGSSCGAGSTCADFGTHGLGYCP